MSEIAASEPATDVLGRTGQLLLEVLELLDHVPARALRPDRLEQVRDARGLLALEQVRSDRQVRGYVAFMEQ